MLLVLGCGLGCGGGLGLVLLLERELKPRLDCGRLSGLLCGGCGLHSGWPRVLVVIAGAALPVCAAFVRSTILVSMCPTLAFSMVTCVVRYEIWPFDGGVLC